MPSRSSDPGIPTLTHRAEPSFHAPVVDEADAPLLTELADEVGPVYENDPFPVLTDVADVADGPDLGQPDEPAPPVPGLTAAPLPQRAPALEPAAAPPAPALPEATVLAARLQAEVEQLMRQALADAVTQLQDRMDAELPAIVSRVLNDVRRG
ncbi:hypothetical protein [Achromobacter sp. MFA1 R4]|uniref:hypothetical protein n=1 Tax=Achromobacter sp. MFA1 R4 TaxID=1881016 RepID=UPI0009536DD4|nr:hypothetical protein [Achromobacter sp. MFA1 R4]SIT26245.1 hypothetical protein SAMN05428937_3227 [Achromobacter sp. MFA1 R4]